MASHDPLPSSDKPSDAELVKELREAAYYMTDPVYERLLGLAASRLSVPREGEWLPIEIAPTDGTPILAYDPNFGGFAQVIAWRAELGWVDDYTDDQVSDHTLWQPLPKSPA